MDITIGQIEFMGEVVGATVVIGDDHAEPLLGLTALESVGIEVDPRNQQLERLPSVRLKPLLTILSQPPSSEPAWHRATRHPQRRHRPSHTPRHARLTTHL